MKTINSLFLSVILKKDTITAALHFDYEEAKDIMIQTLGRHFDLKKDEGIIYEAAKAGEAIPVFNYRAYLSDEPEMDREVGKENKNVKFFFDCPKCHSTEGVLKVDEDSDIVVKCKKCETLVLVK